MEYLPPPAFVPAAPRRRERWWLHALLLLATFGTTALVGAQLATGYERRLAVIDPRGDLFQIFPRLAIAGLVITRENLLAGLAYTVPLLLILLAHELGHYLMCRRYGIDASPPYFLPFLPVVPLPGTFGAFIRVREPIRDKRALFDMAVAGPIAGFLVALPFAAWGIWHTRLNFEPLTPGTEYFGYPLAVTVLQLLMTGHTFTSLHVVEHPTFMAAWWGFVVTAINLIPAGQLDGGHTIYAVFGRRHRLFRWPVLLALFGLGFLYASWWLWAAIVLILTALRRPALADEDIPLDPRRKAVAALVLLILILSFVPVPIRRLDDRPFRSPGERGGTVVHQLDLHRRAEAPGRHGHA
ncbi:MAG: site-2 protease family protein [Thermoanaerobaculia bacterium]